MEKATNNKNEKNKHFFGGVAITTITTIASICNILSFFLDLFPNISVKNSIISIASSIFILAISLICILFLFLQKKYCNKVKYNFIGKNVNVIINEERGIISKHNSSVVKLFVYFVVFAYFIVSVGILFLYVFNDDNYVLKAKNGDVYSQIFLGDYYYEIKDYDNSIYWYKIASKHDDNYGYVASNNLAYLYWKQYKENGQSDLNLSNIYFLLKKSALNGNKIGIKNMYNFVYHYDFDNYETEDDDRDKLLQIFKKNGLIDDISNFRQATWEDTSIIIVRDKMMSSDAYTRYEIVDESGALDPNDNTKLMTFYTYKVTESSLKPDKMSLEYDSNITE